MVKTLERLFFYLTLKTSVLLFFAMQTYKGQLLLNREFYKLRDENPNFVPFDTCTVQN